MNPSWKIDELARRVLLAARWPRVPPPPPPDAPSADGRDAAPTPHLDELERALDARLPPLETPRGGSGDGGGTRTCTLPSGASEARPGAGRSDGGGGGPGEVWTWTPRTDVADNSYSAAADDDAAERRTLEEMAPFSPDFYRALGELAREAFHPGSVRGLEKGDPDPASAADVKDPTRCPGHPRSTTHEMLRSLERYSLPRMMDAARITRILAALQEFNVGERPFVEYMLHYCEGMSLAKDGESSTKGGDGSKGRAARTGKRIPVLAALFHHWGSLARLEHGLQQLSRRYGALLPMNAGEYRDYCDSSSSSSSYAYGSGSVGDGGSTGGEWRPSSSSSSSSDTSFLGERALRMDAFKMRLEAELDAHINGSGGETVALGRGATSQPGSGLIGLLTEFYRMSDAPLRGKCRRWMGTWLRSFALGGGGSASHASVRGGVRGGAGGGTDAPSEGGDGNGLGPSFATFCPLVAAAAPSMTSASVTVGGGAGGTSMMATKAVTGPFSVDRAGGGGMQRNPLGMENTSACGVEALLHVLLLVIAGFRPLPSSGKAEDGISGARRSAILRPSHERLLFDVLMPLHRPSGLVLWRDQTPLVGLYHEALVKAIGAFLPMDGTLVGPMIGALLHPDVWPGAEGGNTPKVVLLLHEADTLVGLLLESKDSGDPDAKLLASFDPYFLPLVSRLCTCISSENSRLSERALQFFRNDTFKRLVQRHLAEVGPLFLRALCRCPGREVPWNPTVRKMTLLVLLELEGYYKQSDSDGRDLFGKACEEAFSGVDLSQDGRQTNNDVVRKRSKGTAKVHVHSGDSPNISGDMTSLHGAMGLWKPPPQKARAIPRNPTRQPPSTVTGVAPWAMGGQSDGKISKTKKQPPLGITGVAPWAIKKNPHALLPSLAARKTSTSNRLPRPSKSPLPPVPSGSEDAEMDDKQCDQPEPGGNEDAEVDDKQCGQPQNNGHVQTNRTALDEVNLYMEKLKPKGDLERSNGGVSSWARAQMEQSPVLLPSLKFHDLVFGQDLGTGAFSTVKYARRIDRRCTRSSWAEYAVKVVSTQKIEELGYEQSINREIAILRMLPHPSIARLVSSFRFRDGAYLILEYASGGDLHSLLRKNGSIDHESTRFVIGSVAAALHSIHEIGFVYADCKPEVSVRWINDCHLIISLLILQQ